VWNLTTPDSTYSVDLGKKQGIVMPNMLDKMAEAYDDLDGSGKKRLHQNMQDMGAMLSRMFSLSGINAGEKLSTKSYAGQECEERKFGPMTVCTMSKAPVMLHSHVSLACFNIEETATEVKLASPPAEVFAAPAGVTWKQDAHVQKPDSVARGFVLYMASQQLADSLAKAKAELAAAQAKAGDSGKPPELTAEQQAGMQQACEKLKNFDMGKALADATNQAMKEIAEAAKRQAIESGKEAATSKIKGLFKKPKIP
jgi:di/tripeptidase